jgi:hypothetical protein
MMSTRDWLMVYGKILLVSGTKVAFIARLVSILFLIGISSVGAEEFDCLTTLDKKNYSELAHEIEAIVNIYLQQGQVREAECLLNDFYKKRNKTIPYFYFQSVLNLLKVQEPSVDEFETPSKYLEKQLKTLDEGLNFAKKGEEELLNRFGEVTGELFKLYKIKLLLIKVKLLIQKGDESFRMLGGSLFNQAQGASLTTTSLVEYGRARQHLVMLNFLGRRSETQYLSKEIEKRIQWIEDGKFFGGLSYYEISPYVDGDTGSSDYTIRRTLKRLIRDSKLEIEYEKGLAIRKAGNTSLVQIKTRIKNKKDREDLRREKRATQLNQRITELKLKISELSDKEKQYAESKFNETVKKFQNNQALIQDLNGFRESLVARRNEEAGKLTDLLIKFTSMVGKDKVDNLPDTSDIEINDFKDSLLKVGKTYPVIQHTFENWPEEPGGNGSLRSFLRKVEEKKAKFDEFQNRIEGVRVDLEKQLKVIDQKEIEKKINEVQREVKKRELEFQNFIQSAAAEADSLKAKLVQNTRSKIETEKKHLIREINRVKKQVEDAKKFFENLKGDTKRIREAYTKAKTAIIAAGKLPTGISAVGSFTDFPASLMALAKSGVRLVEFTNEQKVNIENFQNRIRTVSNELEQYKQKVQGLNLKSLQSELEIELEKKRQIFQSEKAKLEVYIAEKRVEVESKLRSENNRIATEIEKLHIQKIESKTRQLQAQLSQVRLILEEAIGERNQAKLDASSMFYQVRSRIEEIDVLTKKIEVTENTIDIKEIAEPSFQVQTPSPSLAMALQQLKDLNELLTPDSSNKDLKEGLFLEELVGLAQGSTFLESNEYYSKLLIETNSYLFKYANWLFIMTHDPRVLDWAIWSQSPVEVRRVYEELEDRFNQLSMSMAGVTPKLVAVRILQEDLSSRISELRSTKPSDGRSDELWFQVSPLAPNGNDESKLFWTPEAKNKFLTGLGVRTLQPLISEQGLVFWHPELVKDKGINNLLDVYVIPKWKDNEIGLLYNIGIEPVGPTTFNIGDKTTELPLISVGKPNPAQAESSWKRFNSNQDEVHKFIAQDPQKPLTSPVPFHNYPSYMGRGLFNTWKLTFPENKSVKDLVDVTIIFSTVGRNTFIDPIEIDNSREIFVQFDSKQGDITDISLNDYKDEFGKYASYYGRNEFESSPLARMVRIEQLEQAFDTMPDFTEVFIQSEENHKKPVEAISSVILDESLITSEPYSQGVISEVDIELVVKKILVEQILNSYSSLDHPAILNQIPLGLMKREVFEIFDKMISRIKKVILPELTETRITLDESKKTLIPVSDLTSRINWDHAEFVSQKEWIESLEIGLKGVSEVQFSEEFLIQLRHSKDWAEKYGDESIFLKEALSKNKGAADSFVNFLFKSWKEQTELVGFGE